MKKIASKTTKTARQTAEILSIAALMMLTACTAPGNPSAATEEEEPARELFREANLPETGADVSAYSTGIQHVGLPTAKVQETIDFYKGLGFTLATRHDISGRDFAFMQLGSLLIEVIPTQEPAMCNGAVDHFCLDVKNIDELFATLRGAGYHMLNDEIQDIAFWERGARYFFIEGPNGEKIEFCEIL